MPRILFATRSPFFLIKKSSANIKARKAKNKKIVSKVFTAGIFRPNYSKLDYRPSFSSLEKQKGLMYDTSNPLKQNKIIIQFFIFGRLFYE